jgi:hydrogenase maturation protein HypF
VDPYPFSIHHDANPWQVDLRPLVRAVVADLAAARPGAMIAARFHEALAAALAALVAEAVRRHGRLPVVLGGGSVHNAILVESCLRRLAGSGVVVYTPRRVPAGDGGLSLGQALVADAVARGEKD